MMFETQLHGCLWRPINDGKGSRSSIHGKSVDADSGRPASARR